LKTGTVNFFITVLWLIRSMITPCALSTSLHGFTIVDYGICVKLTYCGEEINGLNPCLTVSGCLKI